MRKVGIDLGTTNLLICVDNEGIVIDEPSMRRQRNVLLPARKLRRCWAAHHAA